MNALLACILLYIPATLGYIFLVAERDDRRFLLKTSLAAWVVLGVATCLVDLWLPFTEGGDDRGYFQLVGSQSDTLEETLDIGRYASVMEQPGYPWLLSLLRVVADEQLLAYKLSNLMFFNLLILTWYRIGLTIESRQLARHFAVFVLILSPLYYYTFFLLKDMVIAFIQSLFLLGLLLQWRNNHLASIGLVVGALFSLILFRIPLLLQDGLVVLGSAIAYSLNLNRQRWQLVTRGLGLIGVGALLYLATNPEILYGLGIRAERRILGSDAMWQHIAQTLASSNQSMALFPLIWLLAEVSFFNPDAWSSFDSLWLRGLLTLPWIFGFVPLFLLGLAWLVRRPEPASAHHGLVAWLSETRLLHSPWSVLVLFLISSIAISALMQDTVRYRLPDMPVIAALAALGWLNASQRVRNVTFFLSICGFGFLITTYYLIRAL
jgi:hypothetical protein